MAGDIGTDRISTEHILTKLSWNAADQKFEMCFSNGSLCKARSVIITIPFSVLAKNSILDDSSLKITPEMRDYIDNMPYGTNSKIDVPLSGSLSLTYGVDMTAGAVGWPTLDGNLTIMLGGTPGKDASEHTACDKAANITNQLGVTRSTTLLPTVYNWSQDPFSRGSYRAYTTAFPRSDFDKPSTVAPALRAFSTCLLEKNIQLVFAGEHMHSGKTGYMNSAVISGEAAAACILSHILPAHSLPANAP